MRTTILALVSLALLSALAAPAFADPERRDPFSAYPDEDVIRCCENGPLQRFPVDAMKLQGVVIGTAAPRALVILPDGTAHLVRVGTNVGKNFGRIESIGPKGAVVVEEFREPIVGRRIAQRTLLAVR